MSSRAGKVGSWLEGQRRAGLLWAGQTSSCVGDVVVVVGGLRHFRWFCCRDTLQHPTEFQAGKLQLGNGS